jgi:protein DPCD
MRQKHVDADESELVEEYDIKTTELLLRKKRKPKALGGAGNWEYLMGEEASGFKNAQAGLAESSINVRPVIESLLALH